MFRWSPLQSTLVALNIALVILVCGTAAWAILQARGTPMETLTIKDVQDLKAAITFAKDTHTLMQQLLVLISSQSATMDQLLPLFHDATDAMNALAAQTRRARADLERVTSEQAPPKPGKK